MQLVNRLQFDNLRGDFFGGLTAAVVALPLALAFGVSSGAGAIAGLYGSICVGLMAPLFGGTPALVSGPTGPMTVVMASIFITLTRDNPETRLAMAFTTVMLGGLFQILFGVFRLGIYVTLMPYTVISGFISGIGLIIILLQVGPFLGTASTPNAIETLRQLPELLSNANLVSVGLGVLTLGIVFGNPPKLNRILPAPLLALLVVTPISIYLFPDSDLLLIGDIPTGLPELNWPVWQADQITTIIGYGLVLATLGSIDSLLTSLVADNITRTQHDPDRTLIGQGIGNLLSGFVGGLPGAGATTRTVINVQAGGKTPLSGIIHGLVLLVIVLWAGPLAALIPQTVLAGILIKVGIDIIDWSFLKRAHWVSIKAAGIMYGVMLLTVFVDLIVAVALGVFVANILTIKRLTDLQINEVKAITSPTDEMPLAEEEKQILRQAKGRILLFHLGGPMSFGAAKAITQKLAVVEDHNVLVLDLTDVSLLGVTAALAIESILKEAREKRREVFIVGAKGQVQDRLRRLKLLNLLLPGHQLEQRLQALQKSLAALEGRPIVRT